MAKARAKKTGKKTTAKAKQAATRTIRCYLCGHALEVSFRALSTNCPGCHKAIRIEDLLIKSYTPVTDLQTCGKIKVTKRGRIAAKRIQSGDGIEVDGIVHGSIESLGAISFGEKAQWKGDSLHGPHLEIADGASLEGHICVPWSLQE